MDLVWPRFGAASPPRAASRVVPASQVSAQMVDAMWSIYGPHHDVPRARMDARLGSTLDRVHLFTVDERLVGFLGMRLETLTPRDGAPLAAMYMGLGYIQPEHRRRGFIQRAVIRELLRHWRTSPHRRMVFWTDALSYKPYLIVARNLCNAHPLRQGENPRLAAIADALGALHYGDAYANGVVRKPSRLLAPGVADIHAHDLEDPDIRFYAEKNPGHADGDGLLVVVAADLENLLHFTWRALRRSVARS